SKWIIVTACEMKTKSSCKGEEIMERLCKATNKTRELGKSSKQSFDDRVLLNLIEIDDDDQDAISIIPLQKKIYQRVCTLI
ncbi:unnamed protein product, partial [Didymodactylos carnosus]